MFSRRFQDKCYTIPAARVRPFSHCKLAVTQNSAAVANSYCDCVQLSRFIVQAGSAAPETPALVTVNSSNATISASGEHASAGVGHAVCFRRAFMLCLLNRRWQQICWMATPTANGWSSTMAALRVQRLCVSCGRVHVDISKRLRGAGSCRLGTPRLHVW